MYNVRQYVRMYAWCIVADRYRTISQRGHGVGQTVGQSPARVKREWVDKQNTDERHSLPAFVSTMRLVVTPLPAPLPLSTYGYGWRLNDILSPSRLGRNSIIYQLTTHSTVGASNQDRAPTEWGAHLAISIYWSILSSNQRSSAHATRLAHNFRFQVD